MSKDIESRLMDMLSERFKIDKSQMSASSRFQEDLGADSIDIMELLMSLEEEFGINIPDDEAEKLKSVGDVMKYIESKV